MRKDLKMKRIISYCLICALLAFTLISCGEDTYSVPTGMQIASDTEIVDYLLYVPESWKVDMRTGVTTAYYSVNDPSNISVTMSALEDVTGGFDAIFEKHLNELNSVFTLVGEVESANLILANEAAQQYVYTAEFNDVEYKFWQVVCIHQSRVYTITYSSTVENYEAHTADMQTALDLFCFI